MRTYTVVVPPEMSGLRLDQCLARLVTELSRKKAQLALSVGCVFSDGRRVKVASRLVRPGQELKVSLGTPYDQALNPETKNEPAAVRVVYEDDDLVVVNKPAGTHSVPTPEGDVGTALHQLICRGPTKGKVTVVHRLDMPTSGLLVFAKTPLADRGLSEMFRVHDLERRYDAFVVGEWPDVSVIEAPVRGKPALTRVKVLQRFESGTWLEATLETGRTHQIRLHMRRAGHPVLGDSQYGTRTRVDPPRLALHAKRLAFAHPRSRKPLEFDEPLPEDLHYWVTHVLAAPTVDDTGDSTL